MRTKAIEVLKVGLLMVSIILSCICALYIIVKPGSLLLKISTAIFAIVCWFLTQKILINRKIFALMLINMLALYFMPNTSNQLLAISVLSLIIAVILLYRVMQMSKHKDTLKAAFSSIFYSVFGVISVFLINFTQICPLSIIATTNFAILTYLCVTNFSQGHPIEKELC